MVAPNNMIQEASDRKPAAPQVRCEPAAETDARAAEASIYLLGRPTLRQYLRFIGQRAVHNGAPYEGALTSEWRAAAEHLRTIEKDEGGIADYPAVAALGPRLQVLRDELLKNPLIVHGFNTVPCSIGIVELDRLVVYQYHIDLSHVRGIKERIGPEPGEEDVFRLCLPSVQSNPPVKWSRMRPDRFVFISPSNDLRYIGPLPLQPGNLVGFPTPERLAGVVGLAVGFGSNFLNAIHAENRLILNNGSHRAFALRELGVTHAPCIIQYVSSREELDVLGPDKVRERPDEFLKRPRPPLLKDYFNPKLRKIIPTHRRLRQVTVKFEVHESYIPAW